MKLAKLTIVTNGAGAGSGTTGQLNGSLKKLRYVKTDYATGVDFTVSDHHGETLFTGTNVDATANFHPRQPTHDTAGAASLYAAAGEPVESDIPVAGPLTVTVASGGDTKTGDFYLWVG